MARLCLAVARVSELVAALEEGRKERLCLAGVMACGCWGANSSIMLDVSHMSADTP